MSITPTQQRNGVSEGMALGLLMCGRDTVPYDKVRVDLAFWGAWRSWAYRSRFSQVDTDISKGGDGLRVMTRANERKGVWNLFWDISGQDLVICARESWADDDIDPQVVAGYIEGGVPPEGWRALAEDFLARFER